MYLRFLVFFMLICACFQSNAQGFSMNKLPLNNWDLGNWKQVESVDNPFKKKLLLWQETSFCLQTLRAK